MLTIIRLFERPKLWLLGVAMTTFSIAPSAEGHRSEPKKEPIQRHGGLVKRAGSYNIEWVYDEACVTLYVHSQSNIPLPTSRGTAEAEVFVKNGKKLVELETSGGNRFSNCVDGPFDGVRMVILRVQIHGEKSEKLLFTVQKSSATT